MNEAMLSKGVTAIEHLGISIAYSGIEVGNVDPRFGEADEVRANRAKLLSALRPAKYVVQVPQLSSEFVDLSDIPDDELAEEYPTDGLFINRPNIALGLNTADCIAMTLYGKGQAIAGVIHAGRQGVDGGIHEAAITHMTNRHGVDKGNIRAYFGPAIKQDSYFYPEISSEQLADPKWRTFIDRRNGNYHIDLVGRVIKDLVELEIEPHQIQIAPIDVGAHCGYFSHSRSKRTDEPPGRNGLVAMIRAD